MVIAFGMLFTTINRTDKKRNVDICSRIKVLNEKKKKRQKPVRKIAQRDSFFFFFLEFGMFDKSKWSDVQGETKREDQDQRHAMKASRVLKNNTNTWQTSSLTHPSKQNRKWYIAFFSLIQKQTLKFSFSSFFFHLVNQSVAYPSWIPISIGVRSCVLEE